MSKKYTITLTQTQKELLDDILQTEIIDIKSRDMQFKGTIIKALQGVVDQLESQTQSMMQKVVQKMIDNHPATIERDGMVRSVDIMNDR